MKRTVLAIAAFAIASLAVAQLAKYKDWARSPEAYFLTPEERAEWTKLTNDADAEKFISTYWAKRGGERFKEEIQRRIAAADEQFKMRRQRGAESARGRLLIILGSPSRVSQARAAGTNPDGTPDTGAPPAGNPFATGPGAAGPGPSAVVQTWVYDKEKFDASLGIGELRVRVMVDPQRGSDELQNPGLADRAMAKLAEKSIANPAATAAAPGAPAAAAPAAPPAAKPAVPPAATGPASAPAAAAPAPAGASLPAATRASLEELLKGTKEEPGFWGNSFRAPTATGEPFYALEFYFPGDKAPAGPVKFAGVVKNESGGDVATYWEDATLSEMKTGPRADRVYARSVVLPPGSYRASFGIFPSDGSAPLASASVSLKLESKGTDLEVSPLILTNELRPQTKRPAPTDPFVFGVEKPIQVEPKADRAFAKQDSLWYFYAVTNPKLPEAAQPAAAAPAATPAPGAAAPAAAAEVKPRIMQRIGVLRDGKPAFAPFTGPAEMQALSPGYYASGSEIPLATFEPGYYTFTLNVRDLNAPRDSAAFKGIDRQAEFIVLKPDGALPEKAAPKPAVAPTPKPKPKKS